MPCFAGAGLAACTCGALFGWTGWPAAWETMDPNMSQPFCWGCGFGCGFGCAWTY